MSKKMKTEVEAKGTVLEEEETLESLKTRINDVLIPKYNAIVQGEGTVLDLKKVSSQINECVNRYTSLARGLCFGELLGKKDTMLEAVKKSSFETVKTKTVKIRDTSLTKLELVSVDVPIDLAVLHEMSKGGIGVDKQWIYKAERLNMLFTARMVNKLKEVVGNVALSEVSSTYAMDDISRKIKLHEECGEENPLSDENILVSMQLTVNAMIGDKYKVESKDLAYLEYVYGKIKSKNALKITCATHKKFRKIMCDICHRIATESTYDPNWKIVKEN